MKKLSFIVIFIFLSVDVSFAQSGWYAVSNTPIANNMTSLKFVNQNTGYAACYAGAIAKTTNGGINWILINVAPDTVNFESIQFLNENTGYVIGNGKLYKTTSAGTNWSEINTGTWIVIGRCYLDFINESTGFISGGYDNQRFLKKTTNGGNTWEDKTSSVGGANYLSQVLFLNVNTGFILMSGAIYRTINAGNNWDTLPTPSPDYALNDIKFINETTGYAVGDAGRLLKTMNGGNNWVKITVPILPAPFSFEPSLQSVNFISESTGFICGRYGYIAKSTNGGNNWTLQEYGNTSFLNSIVMTSPTAGCVVGEMGSILITTNGGANWIKQYKGYPEAVFTGVYSADSLTTFAVTDNEYRSGSKIYSTTNGGLDWTYKNSGYTVPLTDIKFTSANTGFIIGDSNKILKTTNRGENWVLKTPALVQNRLFAIFFVNANTGYVSGKYGGWTGPVGSPFVMRTLNGGENWTTLPIPLAESQQQTGDLYFFNADTGFVCGEAGNIYRTTNRGLNWTTINTGFTWQGDYVHSIYFTSVNTGYLVLNHYNQALNINTGKVCKTTNGGLNWINIPLPGNIEAHGNWFYKIRFVNPNIGYMAGMRTGIVKTTNAGNTWFREALIAPARLYGLSFLNGNLGYAVGQGIILKTSPLTDIETVNNIVTNDYLLYQNYPNPFNPVTQIRYNLPEDGFVTLKVFDILGKEIANLINEFNQSGTYEINWNASQYPSGIYFYKLETNNFSQVRKMMLLK